MEAVVESPKTFEITISPGGIFRSRQLARDTNSSIPLDAPLLRFARPKFYPGNRSPPSQGIPSAGFATELDEAIIGLGPDKQAFLDALAAFGLDENLTLKRRRRFSAL